MTEFTIEKACHDDLKKILDLQIAAFLPVSKMVGDPNIQPLRQTLDELIEEWKNGVVLKCTLNGSIIGSVRACLDERNICHINKLVVHPDFHKKGIGKALMEAVEIYFPECVGWQLFTGEITPNTFYLYSKLGYKEISREVMDGNVMIFMYKQKTGTK